MEKSGHFVRHCAELAMLLSENEPGTGSVAYALGFLASAYLEDRRDRLNLNLQAERERMVREALQCRTKKALNTFQAYILDKLGNTLTD